MFWKFGAQIAKQIASFERVHYLLLRGEKHIDGCGEFFGVLQHEARVEMESR